MCKDPPCQCSEADLCGIIPAWMGSNKVDDLGKKLLRKRSRANPGDDASTAGCCQTWQRLYRGQGKLAVGNGASEGDGASHNASRLLGDRNMTDGNG